MTDRAKPTPGPWQVVPLERAVHPWIVGDHECGSIADCSPPGPWMSFEEAAANARLCAAAPDLLAACKALLATPEIADCAPEDKDEETNIAERIARAAIKRCAS